MFGRAFSLINRSVPLNGARRRFSASPSSRDMGVWMRKDQKSEGGEKRLDPTSLAVMGPNQKWHIVVGGRSCVQADAKPDDFQERVCSLEDTEPEKGRDDITHECDEDEDDEYYQYREDLDYGLSNEVMRKIGVYKDPKEMTLDQDAQRLLSMLLEEKIDDEDELQDETIADESLLVVGSKLADMKEDVDVKTWVHGTTTRLSKEGWEIRWDVQTITAEDVFEQPNDMGEVYLESGVWIDKDNVWDVVRTPYLYMPCFKGEEVFKEMWDDDQFFDHLSRD